MMIPPLPPRDDRPDGERGFVSLRDHFAMAALTGLLSNVQTYQNGPLAEQAFEIADFMLRERNGAVERRETVRQPPASRPAETRATANNDSALPVTEPMPVFVSGIGSVTPVSYGRIDENRVFYDTKREPAAWAVGDENGLQPALYSTPGQARSYARSYRINGIEGQVIPLYRQATPALSDDEIAAIRHAIVWLPPAYNPQHITLRRLLERAS